MKNLARSLALAGCLLIASVASAQYVEPPTILPANLDRRAFAEAAADGNFCDRDETLSGEVGPFPASTSIDCSGMHGSSGSGTAQQLTLISTYSISGKGSVSANATVGSHENASVGINVASLIQVSFSVPVDAVFWLRGTFDVTEVADTNGTCGEDTEVRVFLAGTDADGGNIFFDQRSRCQDPPENADFELFETLQANTPVTFLVQASSGLGTEFDPAARLGQRTASFDFDLDVGTCPDPCGPPNPGDPNFDSDRDGLIDSWETDGIDFDGDGTPEIDLEELGAKVGTRDLFVEVDIMEGVDFDQTAIDDVVQAFAAAPPAVPGGNPGINLNVLVDTDQPAQVQLQKLPNGDLPPQYYAIKETYFGTTDNRSHPDWDLIRPVQLGIFRYCLWVNTVLRADGVSISGTAEAIPSNDFIVAGSLISWFTNPGDQTNALAGTFMHELGHAIGLRHGGGEENTPNFKPNYLSVMNYMYQMPFDSPTVQNTNAREAWRLDYSRLAMRSLDETQLVETDGLDGPEGRRILFNSAPENLDPNINIGWARADELDWNNNSMIEASSYQLDVTRVRSSHSPNYDTLMSYSDWDRLRLGASDSAYFDDRQPWPYAERVIEVGIEDEAFLEIQNAEWVDQTALGDLVFENGFELGSTTAWSEAVP